MLFAYGFTLIAVSMDFRNMRISNRLILVGLAISLVYRILCKGVLGILTWICLISFPVILFYLLFLAGALGAGDIKLFSILGGFLKFKELVECIKYAFLFAALFAIIKCIRYGQFTRSMKHIWGWTKRCLQGEVSRYEPISMEHGRIHFSFAILCGLFCVDYILV